MLDLLRETGIIKSSIDVIRKGDFFSSQNRSLSYWSEGTVKNYLPGGHLNQMTSRLER